ncbi:hypothetical protein KAR34_04825, partial [bacterium]|nr:hypothetical protein [bacterium]
GMSYDWRGKGYILPIPGGVIPILYALEPNHNWYVQSRVEWQTRKSIIGGKRLGIELPDIVARARAEIIDSGLPVPLVPASCIHNWRVRLAHPKEDVDRYIRNQIGSINTGGNIGSSTDSSPATPADPDYGSLPPEMNPALNPNLSPEEVTFNYISSLPDDQQYYYYQDKRNQGEYLTNRETCQYYKTKDKIVGLTILERWQYMRVRTKKRPDEIAERK